MVIAIESPDAGLLHVHFPRAGFEMLQQDQSARSAASTGEKDIKDMNEMDILAANKQRARDYFTAFATQDKTWLEANFAPTNVRQDTTLPFEVKGPEGVLALGDVLLGAFSEVELDIQEVIAENDKVLVHLRFRCVHSGPFGDYPASNKRFNVMVLDFFRMEDGMIAEQWPAIDNIWLQQQIGML